MGGMGSSHDSVFSLTEPVPSVVSSPKKVTATQGTQTDSTSEYIDWSSQPANESEILRYQISQREEQPPVLSLLEDPGEGTSSQRESVYNRDGAWNVFLGADGDGSQTGILVTVDQVLREGEEGIIEPEFWLSCGESLEEQQDG